DFTGTGIAQHSITINGSSGTTSETVNTKELSPAYAVDVNFTGGSGDDTFIVGNGVHFSFNGGLGTDTVEFSQITTGGVGVTVDMGLEQVTGAATGTFSKVENAVGTS